MEQLWFAAGGGGASVLLPCTTYGGTVSKASPSPPALPELRLPASLIVPLFAGCYTRVA